ncbi:hypothetical protein [Methylobacterium sp. SD21]|uniref:hypothetical protein n=1 Tax=Methylobacterium litchii TaxID=3138810 RepID=UPI00313AC603
MDETEITCEESQQAAPKPRRRRKAAARGGWTDPSTVAVAFGNVVGVFASKPLAAVLVTVLLGVGAVGYGAYEKPEFRNAMWTAWSSRSDILEAQATRARKDIVRENAVCDHVQQLGKRISAHRLVYFQFSDAARQPAAGGVPWRYSSAVCVYPKPGVDYDVEGAKGVPNSLNSEILKVLFPLGDRDGTCGKWHPEEIQGEWLRGRFERNGTDLKIACGQTSPQGLPVGSLSADWLNRGAITEPQTDVEKILREGIDTINELQSRAVQ